MFSNLKAFYFKYSGFFVKFNNVVIIKRSLAVKVMVFKTFSVRGVLKEQHTLCPRQTQPSYLGGAVGFNANLALKEYSVG